MMKILLESLSNGRLLVKIKCKEPKINTIFPKTLPFKKTVSHSLAQNLIEILKTSSLPRFPNLNVHKYIWMMDSKI